jgi:hypothetical protein
MAIVRNNCVALDSVENWHLTSSSVSSCTASSPVSPTSPVSRLGRELRGVSTKRLVPVTRQRAFGEDAVLLLFVECGGVSYSRVQIQSRVSQCHKLSCVASDL